MAEARVERRLAAILAADVAGYSSLMGIDEEGTLASLKAYRRELVDPKIAEHRGRIVKTTGDGALVEFGSAVDAVRCAIEIQRAMVERNASVLKDRRIEFRIGINIGDIILDEGDIYGDGVNIAARVETLAKPGSICLSENAYQQIKGKVDVDVDDMGQQRLKNIAQSMRVYGVRLDTDKKQLAQTVADKPSIAVLPFTNMSGDPEQEYFADGIAEDIITALAQVRQFFVMARNTSFTYKGRAVDVQSIAKDLGVRYVLEGSVRRAGTRLRITAQLIEGSTGKHLWAERYDREIADVFAVQDEITQIVVGAIGPELSRAEQEYAKLKSPSNLDAWDYYQRGLWHFWRLNASDIQDAIRLFNRSIELDPNFSPALAFLSYAHITNYTRGYIEPRSAELTAAHNAAMRAIAVGNDDGLSHWALGVVAIFKRDHALALSELSMAMDLNPSFAPPFAQYGLALTFCGRGNEALPYFDKAERISPKDPFSWLAWFGRGWAYLFLGKFEAAASSAKRAIQGSVTHVWGYVILVAALSNSGKSEELRYALDDLFGTKKDFSLTFVEQTAPMDGERRSILIDTLRKAGVPE